MSITITAMPNRKQPRKLKFSPAQIKAKRLKAGLTQEEAAQRCMVSRRAWVHYEAGTRNPHKAVEVLIAQL